MKKMLEILKAELDQVIGNHSVLLTVIIAPLLYASLLGSIYIEKDIEGISLAVVDMDHTATSMELTRMLSASSKVDIVTRIHSYEEAVDLLYRQKIQGFLWFPKGFEKKLLKLEGADVKLYLNTTRFLPSNDLNKAVNMVMMTAGSGVRLRYLEVHGINPKHAMELINPVLPEIRPIYNPTNNYGDFLLPGLLFLILQQTLLIGMGESVAVDSEKGKLARYLQGENSIFAYLSGKTAYYLFLYFSYFLIFFWGVYPALGVHATGNMMALLTVGMLFALVISMLAILLGTMIKSQVMYMAIMAFTTYPFFLTSGYSWPVVAMPLPIQWLSQLIPTTHFLHAGTRIVVMGGSWADIMPDIYKLMILFGIFALLASWRLLVIKKKEKQEVVSPAYAPA
jgi:ABC-2 type transport system permease protein